MCGNGRAMGTSYLKQKYQKHPYKKKSAGIAGLMVWNWVGVKAAFGHKHPTPSRATMMQTAVFKMSDIRDCYKHPRIPMEREREKISPIENMANVYQQESWTKSGERAGGWIFMEQKELRLSFTCCRHTMKLSLCFQSFKREQYQKDNRPIPEKF